MTDELATKLVDDLATLLDTTFERWDVYRTALKAWVVRVESQGQREDFNNASLVVAMRLASTWKPLPVVPRRVHPLVLSMFVPKKFNSKWRLEYAGQNWGIYVDTKKQAIEHAEMVVARYEAAAAEWEEKYSWTLHKTEGVDFRWAA